MYDDYEITETLKRERYSINQQQVARLRRLEGLWRKKTPEQWDEDIREHRPLVEEELRKGAILNLG